MGNNKILLANMIMIEYKIQLACLKMLLMLSKLFIWGSLLCFSYRSRGPWAEKG